MTSQDIDALKNLGFEHDESTQIFKKHHITFTESFFDDVASEHGSSQFDKLAWLADHKFGFMKQAEYLIVTNGWMGFNLTHIFDTKLDTIRMAYEISKKQIVN
jgi:hypothetical protein